MCAFWLMFVLFRSQNGPSRHPKTEPCSQRDPCDEDCFLGLRFWVWDTRTLFSQPEKCEAQAMSVETEEQNDGGH